MNDVEIKKDIANRLSLSHLSDDDQQKVLDRMVEIIIARTQAEIWRRLNIEDRKAFIALQEPAEIDEFMKTKVLELKSIIELSALVTVEQFAVTQ
jgi:hypothetical protein